MESQNQEVRLCERKGTKEDVKKTIGKSREVCRTYDAIQSAYADVLQSDHAIQEIRCNVLLEGLFDGDDSSREYTSDFVCIKTDGDFMVRECVFRKYLTK